MVQEERQQVSLLRRKGQVMNKVVLAGLAMSTAMAVGAQAEPLTLSGDQLDKVTAAGSADVFTNVDVFKNKFVDVFEFVDINKFVNSNVNTFGNLALAQSDANCSHGFFGCTAETQTVTDVNFNIPENGTSTSGFWDATSHSQAVSATGSPADRILFEFSLENGNGG
jgi:hypothetical protein